MTTYIINAPILTAYGLWKFYGPLTIIKAQAIVDEGFLSAVGHQDSAAFLSCILNRDIPVNRKHIVMEQGDRALIFRLLKRLPEGKLLNYDELKKVPFELALLERVE